MSNKRHRGQYYTKGNPFDHPAFFSWANRSDLKNERILEPFAGANNLVRHLENMALCRSFASFDIEPADKRVKSRDTLNSFPEGYAVCVTNPPWLAKNSATVRGMPFPPCEFDNLYKFALSKCLDHCPFVAALVPESFVRANLFSDRLTDFISLTARLFPDTGHPVGLALFGSESTEDVLVWRGGSCIGQLSELRRLRPNPRRDGPGVRFNEANGNVGLFALDNTVGPSIRFCDIGELEDYEVKPSGRHVTKIHVDGELKIADWNARLQQFRAATHDVLLTCYKGIRKDGKYRRRLDWSVARGIVHLS
ncbi:MAG: hypothetical protein OXI01_16745 [Albidovulum sp.]|nr:hypothetical protein [Albidovulum sp.]